MKKFKKTIDKSKKGWYNTTEVERDFINKVEFPFSPYHMECVSVNTFFLFEEYCVRTEVLCMHFLLPEVKSY